MRFLPHRVFVAGAVLACVCVSSLIAQGDIGRRAAAQWIARYQRGRLDLTDPRIPKTSAGVRAGLVTQMRARSIGHLEELEAICERLREEDGEEAARLLLELVGVTLVHSRVNAPEFLPASVRQVAESTLDALATADAVETIRELAVDAEADVPLRAAALRAVGRRGDAALWPAIESGYGAQERLVRLAAVDATAAARLKRSLLPLSDLLSHETDETVATLGFDAMRELVDVHREDVAEDVLRHCADTAIAALGRCTWRSDLSIVRLLKVVRSAQAVPALIDVLARFTDSDAREATELQSGTLREAAHDTLVSLTGSGIPMEDPAAWRRWWESVRDEFAVVELDDDAEELPPGRTSTGGFFGIPVRGSRVLFIVDASGSMAQRFHAERPEGVAPGIEVKVDAARAELARAVDGLTADCYFNVIEFGNGADAWQRDMVPATPKAKHRFTRYVEDLRADGGTNLWAALTDGLQWRSMVYGDRYGATYDELFILSDGLPSVGEVQDPQEILRLVAETNRYSKLRINTVYIAGPPRLEKRAAEAVGMSGREFMRELAEQNEIGRAHV